MCRLARCALGVLIGLLAAGLTVPASGAAAIEPLAQVGSTGDGAGQLMFPSGVALDSAGNLYVADGGNQRISEFTTAGSFIRAFGWDVVPGNAETGFEVCTAATTCKAGLEGGGAGELDFPAGIDIDGSANLYVADTNSHRISVFTAAGSFVRAFGKDVVPGNGEMGFEVCTAATTCKAGVAGGEAGEQNFPTGVGLDSSGNLYVGDADNRISVFAGTGSLFRAFGWDVVPGNAETGFEVCTPATSCKMGVSGGGAGQLSSPSGLVIDDAGNLFVADDSNDRIAQFNTSGPAFVRAFAWDVVPGNGETGFEVCTAATTCQAGVVQGGAGQLDEPRDVDLTASGELYVADRHNDRISDFGVATPSFTLALGHDVIPGNATMGFEVCTTGTTCQNGVEGGGAGQLNDPGGVVADCRGAIWVADTDNHRLQRFGEPGTPLPPCPPSGGGTTSDTVAPIASALRLVPAMFPAAGSGGSVTARRTGTSVRYRLSEPATVRFRVERRGRGRRVRGRCVRQTPRNHRRRRCTRYTRRRGSFSHQGVQGANRFHFTGRLRGRKLRPARYRLVGTPTDLAGNRGAVVRAGFRIVR